MSRRCGYRGGTPTEANGQPVWLSGGLALYECPRSGISAESISDVEEFLLRKAVDTRPVLDMDARRLDAMLVLEGEWERRKRSEH